MKNFLFLIFFVVLVFIIQGIGFQLTMTSVNDWYLTLQKPIWTPPSWLFGPVWTLLYLTLAISGWLIFIKVKSSSEKNKALAIYGLQLFLNLLWSYSFFYLKSPGLALLNIILLVLLTCANIRFFWQLYRPAAILLLPYLLWILYATALNASIWNLNA
jgi:translocator protein